MTDGDRALSDWVQSGYGRQYQVVHDLGCWELWLCSPETSVIWANPNREEAIKDGLKFWIEKFREFPKKTKEVLR